MSDNRLSSSMFIFVFKLQSVFEVLHDIHIEHCPSFLVDYELSSKCSVFWPKCHALYLYLSTYLSLSSFCICLCLHIIFATIFVFPICLTGAGLIGAVWLGSPLHSRPATMLWMPAPRLAAPTPPPPPPPPPPPLSTLSSSPPSSPSSPPPLSFSFLSSLRR